MKRFILTTAAVAFAALLSVSANLEAAPHKSGGHVAPARVSGHAYRTVRSHATLVVRGHSMHVPVHVRGYSGWTSRCWLPSFRTYGYYCGADQLWYYWYAPLNQYLPITYMSIYPPTPLGVAPVTTGIPVAMPMPPALPPGAIVVPGPITAPY